MYEAAVGMKQWVSIVGGAHCKFTDGSTLCDLVSAPGSITREFQKELTIRYVLPFFDHFLKSDGGALPFLCGAEIEADVAAGFVLNSTTISCPGEFRRGDVSGDGAVALNDSVSLLEYLFMGGAEPGCADAADVDDGGTLEITDAVALLNYLFVLGPAPGAPGPVDCGVDPTVDGLPCLSAACP